MSARQPGNPTFSDVEKPIVCSDKRGFVVEWLKRLGYDAESRRKTCVRNWASPCDD